MSKVTPFLWFEKDAAGVARYYRDIFGPDNVKFANEQSMEDTPSGSVQVVSLTIFDQPFRLMSAGPHHEFNDAVSFQVDCKDQAEVDKYWDAITKDGQESMCGWCIDKYGVRWQITPENMSELVSNPSGQQAMLQMKKLDIAKLREANES